MEGGFWPYWKNVHHLAWEHARAQTGTAVVNLLLAAANGAFLVWVLFVYGSDGSWSDEIVTRLGASVFSLFVFGMQYIIAISKIPPEIHDQHKRRIDCLEDGLAGKLKFEYDVNDRKYHEIVSYLSKGSDRVRNKLVGRVSLKNQSTQRTVHAAEVTIIYFRRGKTGKTETLDYKIKSHSTGRYVVDIHPGRSESFELFSIDEGAKNIDFGPFANGECYSLVVGEYVVKITASADSMPRLNQLYYIDFRGFDHVVFRPYQIGDTDHDFDPRGLDESGLLVRNPD